MTRLFEHVQNFFATPFFCGHFPQGWLGLGHIQTYNLGCPPSQDASDHQIYYMFSRESQPKLKPLFTTIASWEGGKHPTYNTRIGWSQHVFSLIHGLDVGFTDYNRWWWSIDPKGCLVLLARLRILLFVIIPFVPSIPGFTQKNKKNTAPCSASTGDNWP